MQKMKSCLFLFRTNYSLHDKARNSKRAQGQHEPPRRERKPHELYFDIQRTCRECSQTERDQCSFH